MKESRYRGRLKNHISPEEPYDMTTEKTLNEAYKVSKSFEYLLDSIKNDKYVKDQQLVVQMYLKKYSSN